MYIRKYFLQFLLFLITASLTSGQSSIETKEKEASCGAVTGWSYSSSSSSSSSASGGSSSGSSSFSISAVCVQAKVPGDCIKANELCQWCAQEDFSGQRCNTNETLKEQGCSNINYEASRFTTDEANEKQLINHQVASARIRVGGSVSIPFRVKEPEIYPVDLYYLMDASNSMKDDLESVKDLASSLVETLEELTQGGEGSVQVGFGKFVDKVQTPMTQLTPYRLQHPYGDDTDPPYLFQNVIKLTSDSQKFQRTLRNQTVSGNLDPPEGALDAMLQVVQCTRQIGWRGNALRLLLVATESAYHYAGDGSGFLGGISAKNDGRCHTNKDGVYTEAESQDYPSVSQVVRAVEDKSITPIFAIGGTYKEVYKYVSDEVFRGSTWGVLKSDSSNVVDLVRKAYSDITGKQEIVTSNPDEDILCPWYTSLKPNGDVKKTSSQNTIVGGLSSGSKVFYNLSLSANKHSCAGAALCRVGDVIVKTRQYDDRLTVDTSVIAAFQCEKDVKLNSPSCSGHGSFSCGICTCGPDWRGPTCDVPVDKKSCFETGSTVPCSGRGTCVDGSCECSPGYLFNKANIKGQLCECSECPIVAGLVCSGHGRPTFGGPNNCECTCECDPEWGGDDCGCSTSTLGCIGPDGSVCSGSGTCVCGACNCNVTTGFGGPTCSDCTENCPSCDIFQDCVQCLMYGTGRLNETCDVDCASYVAERRLEPVETSSLDEESVDEGSVLCVALDASDNCKFYFTYQNLPSGLQYKAEEEKRCKPAYSLLIILWCILLFLLIGLILLCCWRCCVYVIDKEEARNYRLANTPGLIPLLPAMGASSVIEFIKAKYLVRRSAKVAVIPVRRSFFNGKTAVRWRTYAGSAADDEFEVLSIGEAGTTMRKKQQQSEKLVVHGKNGDSVIEVEEVRSASGGGAGGANGGGGYGGSRDGYGGASRGDHLNGQNTASTMRFETVSETAPLLGQYHWGDGEVTFKDGEEFGNIEIPLLHDFDERETTFWVELHGQEKGVALGLKRTKVIVIRDEEAGVIGFPKPSYVFKENDGMAVIPVHRTVGMDGRVQVAWFTQDITAIHGQHYKGGRGIVEFADGEVTQHIEVALIPDLIYDDSEKAFNITLEEPKGGASLDLSHCMVTMLCDEECSLVQFPKEAYPFMENCGVAEVSVLRTRNTKGVSIVKWRTEDDTAVAGKDYEAAQGELTFADAATECHIRVSIIDNDVYDESGRAFRIVLSEPSEGTKLAHNVATISIIEDDEPGLFEFSKTSLVMRSKVTLGRLSVIRSLGSDGHISVPWIIRSQDGSTVPPELLAMSGVLEFRNGEISKYLELDLSNVKTSEVMNFVVILQEPSGGGKVGAKNAANVTVFAEEDFGSVSFAQPRFDVTATTGVVTLLVSRKGDVSSAAFVVCETSDQSAISGTHYRGGTISVVFDSEESVKEVAIPVYNDPNHKGQLLFGVTLKSPPGGPKVTSPSEAIVAITCVPRAPVIHAGLAPPGPCMVEFVKPKYLLRRSAKVAPIPIHRSSADGVLLVEWRAKGPRMIKEEKQASNRWSSASSSSDESQDNGWESGVARFEDQQGSSAIQLSLESRDISTEQLSLQVELLRTGREDGNDDDVIFGLKETEVVVLNDVDAGTLGFSKATFSFKEGRAEITIPVHRLGGMDGSVSARWRTVDDSAIQGRDYYEEEGTVHFKHNQISENIHITLLDSDYAGEEDRKFSLELDKFKGGAKSGLRRATIFIVGDEDRSVVQFSKSSYPVIGTSTSARLPVLRTGSFQKRVAVLWRTQDGSAKAGIDYRASQNLLVFEPEETKLFIEVPLSGKASDAKVFTVILQPAHDQAEFISSSGDTGRVSLGANSVASISVISGLENGTFEFSKPSFLFKTSGEVGLVPVVRSGGTDGEVSIPWKIESLDDPSPFAGAEGSLTFGDGQISSNIEIGLEGVPSDTFVVVLLPSYDGSVMLGSTTRAAVTIIGEIEKSTIEMDCAKIALRDVEIVEVSVVRKGNLDDATYVGWKTRDGSAINGKHIIGGSGNLVFEPQQSERKILIPVLSPPTDAPASFAVQLTDVRGMGRLGDIVGTDVTLEPVPSTIVQSHHGLQQSAPTETIVEFLRKRYLFRQSQGSSFVPVRRSDANGMLALHWRTQSLSGEDETDAARSRTSSSSSSSSDDAIKTYEALAKGAIDWGSGSFTFDDGEHEADIEIVVCREMAHREASFRIELVDLHDRVTMAVPTTMVTVIRDKDPGMLGFASPRYDFDCSDPQLVVPVHRSAGADGTVAASWFTRDSSAVGGVHYLPGEGNLVFMDGEVLKKIILPMPKNVHYFGEDEVCFFLTLGDPTGGASLNVYEATVVLRNDMVPAQISFAEPRIECAQSRGMVDVPLRRSQDFSGHVTLTWQSRGAAGKAKSRYEGKNGMIVFGDGEMEKNIQIKLPSHVQPTGTDTFLVTLEQPSSGRATLGDYPQCTVSVDNDITPGNFSIEKSSYSFRQCHGRDTIRVMRRGGDKGTVTLPWRIIPSSDDAPLSPMHNLHGSVDFDDGQAHADVTVIFPPDSEDDVESLVFMLLPPDGRAELDEPYKSRVTLHNDLKCEVSFTKANYDVRGDIDTLLVPVVRDGPKGRQAAVDYTTIEGSALDCIHFIGGEGTLVFEPGENKKDILVPIMNDVSGGRVTFTLKLSDVRGAAEMGANDSATVHIDNVAGHGVIEMGVKEMTAKQTSKAGHIVVVRKMGRKGAVEVPWFVERAPLSPSYPTGPGMVRTDNYDKLEGTLKFDDGQGEKKLVIPLSEKPQDHDVTSIDVTLLTPKSVGGVILGDVTSTRLVIENDLDGGRVDFMQDKVDCFGTDGEVRVPVVRSGALTHPCQVTWEAHDDSAVRGKHYRAGKGSLAFAPGDETKDIIIPIVNDPSGDVMYFNVTLNNPRGGVKLGSSRKAQVMIDHVQEMRKEVVVLTEREAPVHVHGRVGFAESSAEVRQSEVKVVLLVERTIGNRGRVVVPWSIESTSEKSPYWNLHGQEEFKDHEDESHIEIDTPVVPQKFDLEEFRVVLGNPTGGASLHGGSSCVVTVVNDVRPGRVAFPDEKVTLKQSDEEIVIPIERSVSTSGKARVPWHTSSDNPRSPFDKISGIETFQDGEDLSHIRIRIPQEPQDSRMECFTVTLSDPKTPQAVLGDNSSCDVIVENDNAPCIIAFDQSSARALQSKERVRLVVVRKLGREGRVVVPWKVVPESPDSVYVGVDGETTFEDGEDHANIEVPLPQLPLSNVGENVNVILEPPAGAPAMLADDAMCNVTVTHDIGEGLVELRSRDLTCNSEDGYASVTVVRKLGHDFSAEVSWSTEDGDAISGHHYETGGGRLKFKPGEVERNIQIPLVNDPTGETRHFYVKLHDVKGRDKLGDVTDCKVKISSEATPPDAVTDFTAGLSSPQSIKASWRAPLEGAPVDGYKVTYWSRPGTVKTVGVPKEKTEVDLDNLQAGTPYQLNVRPLNDVGDGPSSDTVVVETQPELRLSYHTPMQARSSEAVASFNLKRNIKDFTDVITWKLVKETRRKRKSMTSSSSSSTSSSSSYSSGDQPNDEQPLVVSSGVLEFPPGTDQLTVQYPLKQDMRHSSQIYRFVAKQQPRQADSDENQERSRQLANIELNVINDTGYPSRVRRPLAASSSPFEATVSWEGAPPGGPVEGYKIIARGGDEPDVVADVGPNERKTTLKGLRPSTHYAIIVQPYNRVGDAKQSPPAHVTTQDELKVEFSERFYTFKSSDKVAVIPIRRHFTRGFAALNWNARWSKNSSEVIEDYSSSSESEQEETTTRSRSWASGSVAFPDGEDTAEVRIPLQQAPIPPKKKSFFWLHVVDPNKQKRLAAMRIKLVDDRADRGVVAISPQETSWPTEGLEVEVERRGGFYGPAYCQWELVADDEDLARYFPDLKGDVRLANGERKTTLKIPTASEEEIPYLEEDLHFSLNAVMLSPGVELDEDSQPLPVTIEAKRGVVAASPEAQEVKWPAENDEVAFHAVREGGANGPAYLVWEVVEDPRSISGFGKIPNSYQHSFRNCLKRTSGDIRFAHGEDKARFAIPVVGVDGQGPTEDTKFPVQILPISPGVKVSHEREMTSFVLKKSHPGVLTFDAGSYEVITAAEEAFSIPVIRRDGCDGAVSASYRILDKSARAGVHYDEDSASGVVSFSNGMDHESISIPLIADALYRDPVKFVIELGNTTGDAKLDSISEAEVTLLGNYIEPAGRASFHDSDSEEDSYEAMKTPVVAIPVRRSAGTGGKLRVLCSTKEGSALEGVHYQPVNKVLEFEDGEESKEVKVEVLLEKYGTSLNFDLELSSLDAEEDIGSPSRKKITLLPTHVEPSGTITTPADEEQKELKVDANQQSSLTIPIARKGGSSGDASVAYKTKDGTARGGQHYSPAHGVITMNDGEVSSSLEVTLLQESYREELFFFLEFVDPKSTENQNREMKIYLLPTDKEPLGTITLPEDGLLEVNAKTCDTINVPITREDGIGGDVSVKIKCKDGSAIDGIHYKGIDGVVNLKDRQDKVEVPISVIPEKYREDLYFSVEISDPTGGAEVTRSSSTVRLISTDIEPPGHLSFDGKQDADIIVDPTTCDSVCIPVVRSGGAGGELTIGYKTVNGSATEGTHFEKLVDELTLKDDETCGEVIIPLHPAQFRENRDFFVYLQSDDGTNEDSLLSRKIILLPTDKEPPGSITLPEDGLLEVNAKTCDTINVPITREDGIGGDVSVKIKCKDGSAIDGIHYKGIDGVVNLKDRQDKVEVPISVIPEKYREDLYFSVEISDPTGGAEVKSKLLKVKLCRTEESPRGRLLISEEKELCYNSLVDPFARVPIKRVDGHDGVLSAKYQTFDGTATSDHYETTKGTISLSDGEQESVIEIPLRQSKHTEELRFELVLQPGEGGDGTQEQVVVLTLEATETPVEKSILLPSTNISASSLTDDFAVIPVRRRVGHARSKVVVPFAIKPLTAKPMVHYVPVKGQVEIPEKAMETQVRIPLMETPHERPLTLDVEFDDEDKSLVNITLVPNVEDAPGRVEFASASHSFTLPKSSSDHGIVSIPVRRRKGTGGRVGVDYFTRDNSAISGKHFVEASGHLVFEDGERLKMVDLLLLPGSPFTEDVNLVLELGAATGRAEVAEIYETEITLEPPLDETDPGVLGFASTKTYFTSSKLNRERKNLKVEIPVRRTLGSGGRVAVDYFLRDNTAVSGKHFIEEEGEVQFEDKEALKKITIDLIPGAHFSHPVSFTAELGETHGGAELGIYETEVLLNPKEQGPHSLSQSRRSSSSESSSSDSLSRKSSDLSSSDNEASLEIREYVQYKSVGDGTAGKIGFPSDRYDVIGGVDAEAVIPVTRTEGFTGEVEVAWGTRESSAEVDEDFVESFDRGVPDDDEERCFIVELGQPEGGADIGRYETSVFILPRSSKQSIRLVAPRNVRAVVNNATCFTIAWDPQEAPVHEYLVSYKRAGSHDNPKRHTVPSSDHSLTLDGLVPESAYAVVVSALGEGRQQVSSDVVGCKLPGKIPGPPNRLAFQVLSPTSLNCSWGEPAITNGLITGYEVRYVPSDEEIAKTQAPVVVRIPDGQFRSLLVENLLENTTYAYTVKAENNAGLGAPREATMKIEHVGSRPPSAIFLDEDNMKLVQQQIALEEAQRQERLKSRTASSTSTESEPGSSRVTSRTLSSDTPSSATKTRVTRYIHREGRADPDVETVEYDGRLTQEELNKKNIQVITYNTSRDESPSGHVPKVTVGYAPEEYSNMDVQTDVSRDTQVFTDVQESQDGDTEVTTITKTYKTTTTERRMETSSGLKSVMLTMDGRTVPAKK